MGPTPNCVFTKEIIRFPTAMKYASLPQQKTMKSSHLPIFPRKGRIAAIGPPIPLH